MHSFGAIESVGKMFVLKDCLKDLFSARYGDIEFGGQVRAACYVHITDGTEETIANWLRSMGWRVEVDPASASDAAFAYQLTRANDPTRLFRVEFDASDPVSPPPPAWGW